jgi:methionyl-tRNA synthetase
VGFGSEDPADRAALERWWPADLHVVGKDITRFHTVIWPAMLLSAGVPIPRQVLGHGWVTFKGEKLSKSLGNIVDPLEVTARYGPDPLRFFLLKEVPLTRDGDFTWDLFIERYNTELANDLGNLVSRTLTMAVKYFEGDLPAPAPATAPAAATEADRDLIRTAEAAIEAYRAAFERYAVDEAIAAVWTLVRRANQAIEETAPWKLAKEGDTERLAAVLNALLESVRLAALLLTPVLPRKCAEIRSRLHLPHETSLEDARWAPGAYRPSGRLEKPEPLFPRIDVPTPG